MLNVLSSLSIFILVVSGANAETYELQDLKTAAKKNNHAFNALKYDQKYYKLEEESKKSNFYPRIGIQAGLEKTKTATINENEFTRSIYGELNLFNGFRDLKKLEISKLESLSANSRLEAMNLDLDQKIEELFYRYLLLYHSDKVLEEEILRNKRHITLIKKRLSSSLVTESDLMEFELHRSNLDSKHEFLELKIKEVKQKLLGMSGLKNYNTSLRGKLPHYKIEESLEEILSSVSLSSLKIYQVKNNIEKSQLEIQASNSGWMPKVDLKVESGYLPEEETGFSHRERSSLIGVFAKWELFSGFSTFNERKMAQVHKIKHEYKLKQIQLDSKLRIRSTYSMMKALEKRIDSEEKNLSLAKKLYERVKKEFQKGVKDSGVLASISQQLAEISVRVFELKKNYTDYKIILESILSRPLKLSKLDH